MAGGVYAYRARKPNARFRIPILSYHWAYVGETTSFYHRHRQHMGLIEGGRNTGRVHIHMPKPWTDLEPYVAFRIGLPQWKWLLRSVETLVIMLLWPVYNDRKNHWNPRRITLPHATAQRARRAAGRTSDFLVFRALWWAFLFVVLGMITALWLNIFGMLGSAR